MGDDVLGVDTMGRCIVALLDEHRMRDGVVVQTGDVPEVERQVRRRLAIRGIEGAVLGGVLIGAHAHMEGSLDGRNGAFDLHIHAIACAADYAEAIHLREANDRVIVFLAGTKLRGKLRHGKEVPVGGAGRIVELVQKDLQACLIA